MAMMMMMMPLLSCHCGVQVAQTSVPGTGLLHSECTQQKLTPRTFPKGEGLEALVEGAVSTYKMNTP